MTHLTPPLGLSLVIPYNARQKKGSERGLGEGDQTVSAGQGFGELGSEGQWRSENEQRIKTVITDGK